MRKLYSMSTDTWNKRAHLSLNVCWKYDRMMIQSWRKHGRARASRRRIAPKNRGPWASWKNVNGTALRRVSCSWLRNSQRTRAPEQRRTYARRRRKPEERGVAAGRHRRRDRVREEAGFAKTIIGRRKDGRGTELRGIGTPLKHAETQNDAGQEAGRPRFWERHRAICAVQEIADPLGSFVYLSMITHRHT